MENDGGSAARWAILRALVEEAFSLPAEERLAFLRAKITDPKLLAEAEELLGFDQATNQIFPVIRLGGTNSTAEEPMTGMSIGSYRVLGELGRGGMGAVFLAERADGAYTQRVAIKLLQEHISSPQMESRFLAERQILARLNHPGISRLLDGGLTPSGRPFLVLEYVDGLPIDRYCEEQQLDTEARLRLFLKVAAAIQAAHQQLILHLDLKPANILISADGEPHLLDFGIARILDNDGLTQPSLMLMTPRYASPEQAEGKPLSVASDVFSLGTLLYRLLTGVLPYPIEDASPLEAARMIRDKEPLAPSKAAPEKAAELRGDLDLILLKAMRKEPGSRYPTVAAFADDVERYMASRPVLAHKGSTSYRGVKFARRNWAALTASAVFLIAAAVSIALIVRSAREARRQEAAAEQRLQDVRAIANSTIVNVIPALSEIPGTLDLRKQLVDDGLKYLNGMSNDASSDPKFYKEMARGFYTMGEIQGYPQRPNLGDREGAIASYKSAIEFEKRYIAHNPTDSVPANGRIALNYTRIANVLNSQGKIFESLEYHRIADEMFEPVLRGEKNTRWMQIANEYYYLAHIYGVDNQYNLADPETALKHINRALALVDEFGAAQPKFLSFPAFISERAYICEIKAEILNDLGHQDEAADLLLQQVKAMEGLKARGGLKNDLTNQRVYADVYRNLALIALEKGDLAQATALSQKGEVTKPEEHETGGDRIWQDNEEAVTTAFAARLDFLHGKTAQAMQQMEKSLAAARDMHKRAPDIVWPTITLVHHLLEFADLKGMPAANAHAMYEEALSVSSAYSAKYPRVLSSQVDEARAHIGLARLARQTHDDAAYAKESAMAKTILENIISQRPANVRLRNYRKSLEEI